MESTHWKRLAVIATLFIALHIPSLAFNGLHSPDFIKVLYHNPIATHVLNNYPTLYNPTPEIFVDRSTHLDLKRPSSAVYKHNDLCKKAYILKGDVGLLLKECGFIPKAYQEKVGTATYTKGVYVNF